MSGYRISRLYLTVGWLAVVGGIGWYDPALAAIVGGIALITYGLFAVDVTKPAKQKQPKSEVRRDPETLERVRVTTGGR